MKALIIETDTHLANLQCTALLANALSENIQVSIIAPSGVEKEYFSSSVKVLSLPMGNTKRNFLLNTLNPVRLRNFVAAIKSEHPDIIHFREPFQLWPALCLPWLRKYKIVTSFFEVIPFIGRPDKIISRKMYLRYSRCLITVSQDEKKNLESLGVTKKCYVIPEGEHSLFARYTREGVRETESVLFFGLIEERKGLEYLIEAAPLISEKVPQAKIVIAGRGDLRKYSRLIANAPNLELHNAFIPDEKVAEFFQQARVVVLPYTKATGSSVATAAYAFGKPVVVTDVGSLPEIVEHGKTGLVVPPRDPKALAEAIIQLLTNDGLRQEMGRNANLKARQELAWDKLAERTINVYHEAMEG